MMLILFLLIIQGNCLHYPQYNIKGIYIANLDIQWIQLYNVPSLKKQKYS